LDATTSVNEKITVEITPDKMYAYVIFDAPVQEGRRLTHQEIIKEIERHNIKKGLNKKTLATILQDRQAGHRYLLASGLEAKVGEAGKVVPTFDISKQSFKPILQNDGTVDYKNLDNVTLTKAGEVIAELIPPSVGDDGYNIPGDVLPGKEGKAVLLPKGKGTRVSEDGMQLIAETNGRIIYVDGKITVSDLYEVSEDVGPGTGNINFNGSVVVRGNIVTGFSVKATGNVEVFGVVEGAEVFSGGNILISKGVAGLDKAFLQASGNITCKIIQNATVEARGDIFAEAIMHSKAKAQGRIEISGKKGLLVGGRTHAVSGIKAKTIGSYMGTKTDVHIGGDTDYLAEYNLKLSEYTKTKTLYEENLQYLDAMLKQKEAGVNMAGMRNSLLNTINTTKTLKSKMEELKAEVDELAEVAETDRSTANLVVENVIYHGVHVRIGGAKIEIDRDEYKCKLRNSEGVITISPD